MKRFNFGEVDQRHFFADVPYRFLFKCVGEEARRSFTSKVCNFVASPYQFDPHFHPFFLSHSMGGSIMILTKPMKDF